MSELKLTGIVDSVIYNNQDNGYTVMELDCDGESVVCVGCFGNVYEGEKLTVIGDYTLNSTYGRQFKAESFTREIPETAAEMLYFLSSGLIRGIREKTARKIVSEFGDESFNVIAEHPERLARISGITKEKAKEISKAFNKLEGERNAIISLEKYGLSSTECIKAFKAFGNMCVKRVQSNPFDLCISQIGVSFEKACEVSQALPDRIPDSYRYDAGIIYVLTHNLSNGHTCIPRKKITEPAIQLLGCTADDVDSAIERLINDKRIVSYSANDNELLFLFDMYNAEMSAAKALVFAKHFVASSSFDADKEIERAELIGGVVFNAKQKEAIKTAAEKGIIVLTGGPGTGKTTTLRGILRVFEAQNFSVCLAAPTGRAAKRMSELTGKEAKTIHRLLEVEWDENDKSCFKRCKSNPLDTDAVIIDELSMVDSVLFYRLLDALPIGCRLVLVGDSDQLPSVGPGNVLHDLIDSMVLPVVKLNEVFRQAMESLIIQNAHNIVEGIHPVLDCRTKDFFFMERNMPYECAVTISQLCVDRLPKAYGYDPVYDLQVLCPSKKGDTGTFNLNKLLQNCLNPTAKGKREIQFGSRVFREGDKVMQNKNNYDIFWVCDGKPGTGVYNGDIGIVTKIDNISRVIKVLFDDREADIPFEFQLDLELAYAVTVHKSQGNEFNCVIIPVTGISEMLTYRNLFYTAVTRAKKHLILVGSQQVVYDMTDNDKRQKRYSGLKHFLLDVGN